MSDYFLPPVSIGIPFYNVEATLHDSIRSVFSQTHQDWELILMDDGSTDGSLEIAKSIDDPRVRVYSDGKNKKLAARLNEINCLARFDYVARMDADDLMSCNRIERQLSLLVNNGHLDLVSTGVCSLNNDCEPIGVRCVASQHQITPRGLLAGQSGIVHASILGRREWFARNPYREDLAKSQDTNLWVRAFSNNDLNVSIVPEPLYFYREDDNVTVDKLLLAYRIGRMTVLEDALEGFSFVERSRALLSSYAKSGAVTVLSRLGRLDIIRQRRIKQVVTESERAVILNELRYIQSINLPLLSSCELSCS